MTDITILIPVTTYAPSCVNEDFSHEWLMMEKNDPISARISENFYECEFCGMIMGVELHQNGFGASYYNEYGEIDTDVDPNLFH